MTPPYEYSTINDEQFKQQLAANYIITACIACMYILYKQRPSQS